jgi:hypothetical protein
MTEARYVVPRGADWAVWDDVNGVLTFMTDADAVQNARQNEAMLGAELGRHLPPDPTPEQAWAYVTELWEGDPGGRGWQVSVPEGATWVLLSDDEEPGPNGAGGDVRVRRAAPGRGRVGGAGLLTQRWPRRGRGGGPGENPSSCVGFAATEAVAP